MKLAKFNPRTTLLAAVLALVPLSFSALAKDEVAKPAVAATQAVESLHKIHINTASADELQLLKGVGKAKAQAIVEFRESHGKFESIEQLELVKGIGKKLIEKNADVLML